MSFQLVDRGDELYYQPCPSPVWDTSLAANALIESDLPPDHPALHRAGEWMLSKQVLVPGDWKVKRPHVQPGGWAFQYGNDFYPDLDDAAMVLMALEKIRGMDADRVRLAKERGVGWFLGMQNEDGGWASFDADNNRLYLNNIPFADHGALLDPSTEDLTGRGLELLGTLGYPRDLEAVERAVHFIRRSQRHDGPWYGRWGVNYIYGTWSVLRGLGAIGIDPRHEYVQRAVRLIQQSRPVARGMIGTEFRYRPYDELRRLGLRTNTEAAARSAQPANTGMLVVERVQPGSSADNLLAPGDVLVRLNGKLITGFEPLDAVLDDSVGGTVKLEFERGGNPFSVQVNVQDLNAITPASFLEFGDGIHLE